MKRLLGRLLWRIRLGLEASLAEPGSPRDVFWRICRWLFTHVVHLETPVVPTVLLLASVLALKDVLFAPTDFFPVSTHAMGHLTKIKYIADAFLRLQWPAWFPYWYNGSTVMQYYPPLSYLALAPVQMAFNSTMLTYKAYALLTLLIGTLGVWAVCRRWVGAWVGLWGGLVFAWHPFILRTIHSGVIAQGPIIALSSWLLYSSLAYTEKPSAGSWILSAAISATLVLSHPMHALLSVIGVALVLFALVLYKQIPPVDLVCWILAVGLGAGLVAFWWVPGVTQIETPGVPVLHPGAIEEYTADLSWFRLSSRMTHGFYFSLSTLLVACLFTVWWLIQKRRKSSPSTMVNKLAPSIAAALVGTLFISFGHHFDFMKYVPMAENLLPGRILTFSAVLVAVLAAFWLRATLDQSVFRRRLVAATVAISVIAVCTIDMAPGIVAFFTDPFDRMQIEFESLPFQGKGFDAGRLTRVWLTGSEPMYFPMLLDINMADGWNIEGTPHNEAIWKHNVAIAAAEEAYVVKNLADWNVRAVYVDANYRRLREQLERHGYKQLHANSERAIMFNPAPPTYFMKYQRNSIGIGRGAHGLSMAFPWLVLGRSPSLEDYTLDDLEIYDMVVIAEPAIKNAKIFENRAVALVEAGKTVIIEMGVDNAYPILGLLPYPIALPTGFSLQPLAGSPLKTSGFALDSSMFADGIIVDNLDQTWLALPTDRWRDASKGSLPVVGSKKVNGGSVYLIGLNLGQHLEGALRYARGIKYTGRSASADGVRAMLEEILEFGKPQKALVQPAFPVLQQEWRHDGFTLRYESEATTNVLVSITHSPRWKATIDGKALKIRNAENLMLVQLPEGTHTVEFRYGFTWVGTAGLLLSLASLHLTVAFYLWASQNMAPTNRTRRERPMGLR